MLEVFFSSSNGHSGSGFNRLCVPEEPEFGLVHYDKSCSGSFLYGQEYETSGYGIRNLTSLAHYRVPCTVCEVDHGPVMMVPGVIDCPANWEKEYDGYLLSNYYSSHKGEYVCVDREAEKMDDSRGNWNQGR